MIFFDKREAGGLMLIHIINPNNACPKMVKHTLKILQHLLGHFGILCIKGLTITGSPVRIYTLKKINAQLQQKARGGYLRPVFVLKPLKYEMLRAI